MNHTILITGTGGPAGINVLRHLTNTSSHTLYAADADPDATGGHLVEPAYHIVLPRADHHDYLPTLLNTVTVHGIDTLIVTTAEELELLSTDDSQQALQDAGARCWTPTHEAIITCNNKQHFATALHAAAVAHPVTTLDGNVTTSGPWIVKPANGRGSRGISYHTTKDTIGQALKDLGTTGIVQQVAAGTEFTADTLTLRSGETVSVTPRWRLETKAGISTKGRTFTHPMAEQTIRAAITAVGLTGPACVQGFIDEHDNVVIIEINPRYSGGLALTLAAGADTVTEYVNETWNIEVNRDNLMWEPNVTMYRYFDAVYTRTTSDGVTQPWTPAGVHGRSQE